MKNNYLSVLAIILSVVALLMNFFTLSKVNKIQEVFADPYSNEVAEDYSGDESMTSPSFDNTLVGDWSGTVGTTTLYVKMKILEDSSIIIESQNGSSEYLYTGHIEDGMTVIDHRAKIDLLEEHEPGDAINIYLENPNSFEMEDYNVIRMISYPASDKIAINYGLIRGSGGEETATLSKQ